MPASLFLDPDGERLAFTRSDAVVDAALKRREVVEVKEGVYQLRPGQDSKVWNELSPMEKRNIHLARQRKKR